jgi:3-hydroxyacyl-CoA dehydrogenase
MNELVSYSQDGEIAVITINNPPVNALSPGVPEGIAAGVARANADEAIKGIVLIGGGRTFIAGADIKEFGKVIAGEKQEGSLLPLLSALEDSPKPVVAALHGTAFGGGLEIAMACHYRVAAKDAQVGQPEVKLGIIPGAAGTQRLPRLAGVAKAIEMCVSGAPVKAAEALAAGIVDQLIEGDLLAGAKAFLREKIAANARHPKTRERHDKLGDEASNAAIFAAARESAKKTARGLTAPFAAIDAIEAATRLPFDEGARFERKLFEQCLFSEQA